MGRLWAAFDVAGSEPSGAKRGFKPDEMATRRMIAAISGSASVVCAWCGNRVKLDAAMLQDGGWKHQDYYLCSACRTYGSPQNRQQCSGHECWSCKMDKPDQDYWLAGGEFGDVEMCDDCKKSYAWATVAGMFKRIYKGKPELTGEWWRVLPLAAEHECELCHEHAPCADRWDITPWLAKLGKTIVCRECNKIAAEV